MARKKQKPLQTENTTPRKDAFDAAWEKFRPLVPEDELVMLEASFHVALDPTIRLHPQKSYGNRIANLEQRYGWQAEPIPFCRDGYRLKNTQETSPGQTAEHRCGAFYIQDSASMLPVSLFNPEILQNQPLILDMAASPGGKTTHLSASSQESGLIITNDSSASRVTALKKVLKNWGSIHHAITNFSGEFFGQWYPNTFDIILLDAPCSMQSLVSIDSHPMRPITEREENALAERQQLLLDAAIRALKPGGQIVYSTCTLSPLEDEAVVDKLLKKYGSLITVADAQRMLPWPAPGITSLNGMMLDLSLANTVRLWPHRYRTSGFFAALIQKNGPSESPEKDQNIPLRLWEKSGFKSLRKDDHAAVLNEFSALFGMDFSDFLEKKDASLWSRGEEIWILPEQYLSSQFATLPVKSAGLRAATRTSSGWTPDFDFVCLIFDQIQTNRYLLDNELTAAWLRKEDLRISVPTHKKGSILFMTDPWDVFIGCGFISGERIRNLNK